MSIDLLEPFLEKRIESARERARKIMNNQHESIEDSLMYLCVIISQHYGIPLFDKYFKDRSIDDLIFEVEIISLYNKPKETIGHSMLKEKAEEASGMFDDMVEEDERMESMEDMAPPMSDDEFMKMSSKFMQTGDFIEE